MTTTKAAPVPPRVAIVGGGLAGLAAAVGLADSHCRVTLFEGRRQLGGRAASFYDAQSGELVDHCQHVSMGCCTNLADFCRRTGIADLLRRDKVLHFIDRQGRRYDLQASRWLPAPLHLAPAFWRLRYLSRGQRLAIGLAVWKLLRLTDLAAADNVNAASWLQEQGQSSHAIEQFWAVILVSALGESLEHASLLAARKVLVDGFAASRRAYEIEVPQVPLGEFYGRRLQDWLAARGVEVQLGRMAREVGLDTSQRPLIRFADGANEPFDMVVAALPWRPTAEIFAPELRPRLPWLAHLGQIHSAPITGVHLWFDRPITNLPHAVIVGRLSQWIFARPQCGLTNLAAQNSRDIAPAHCGTGYQNYYQVVISASHELVGRGKPEVIEEVRQDLMAVLPGARGAELLAARLVTEPEAVFSVRCGLERLRPPQDTGVPGLLVAGDWTATGWPATMEGAVRSGYLAAEQVLDAVGVKRRVLAPDLPQSWLARLLIRAG